ncbi:hypothetical protein [Roseovarius marisflavi]|nr:hypothetical protein [Roseovarius marisflavi]
MTTKAMPALSGIASKKSVSACKPPADAPSPMTGVKAGAGFVSVGFEPDN